MEELVSIIIPVYNAENTIERCINTLISQTYSNIEIIIINDGSTDNSENLINQYVQKDNRIKLINIKNNGVSNARNTGINYSKGKYIMFVDADDYISSKMIEVLVTARNEHETFVICNYYMLEKDLGNVEQDNVENINTEMIDIREKFYSLYHEKNIIKTPWGKLYDANIIKDNNLAFNIQISLGEDFIFNLEYMRFVKKICYVDSKLYYYFRSNNMSLSQKYYPNMMEIQLKIKENLLKFIEDEKCNEKEKVYIKALKNLLSELTNEFHGTGNLFSKYKRAKKVFKNDELQEFAKMLHKENLINIIFYYTIKYKLVITNTILKKFI